MAVLPSLINFYLNFLPANNLHFPPVKWALQNQFVQHNDAFHFVQHRDAITMVKFGHNDNSLLCCSSADGTATVCRTEEQPAVLHTLRQHMAPVTGEEWLPVLHALLESHALSLRIVISGMLNTSLVATYAFLSQLHCCLNLGCNS